MTMESTQQENSTQKSNKSTKKEPNYISMEQVQKFKITEKDLELLPSARSIYGKGRASKSTSGKSEKKTSGVKSTDQYKDLDRIIKGSAKSCTVDRKDKKPEEVAKDKETNINSMNDACSKVLKNKEVDYREVEKLIRVGSKVLCDAQKPVSTGK